MNFDNLRAKHLKEKDISDGLITLKMNTPKLIDCKNNADIAVIHEQKPAEDVDEYCYIHSVFNDEATAMICNEFRLDFLKKSKAVDLSYYYFAADKNSKVYLYDFKKTFAQKETILHLIEQWESSICDAKYCIEKTREYKLANSDIYIGVITENNDTERRNIELAIILYPEPIPDNIPSSIKSKRLANYSTKISEARALREFDKGKVTISGVTYHYDIRTFINKKHEMYFIDGILNPEITDLAICSE